MREVWQEVRGLPHGQGAEEGVGHRDPLRPRLPPPPPYDRRRWLEGELVDLHCVTPIEIDIQIDIDNEKTKTKKKTKTELVA